MGWRIGGGYSRGVCEFIKRPPGPTATDGRDGTPAVAQTPGQQINQPVEAGLAVVDPDAFTAPPASQVDIRPNLKLGTPPQMGFRMTPPLGVLHDREISGAFDPASRIDTELEDAFTPPPEQPDVGTFADDTGIQAVTDPSVQVSAMADWEESSSPSVDSDVMTGTYKAPDPTASLTNAAVQGVLAIAQGADPAQVITRMGASKVGSVATQQVVDSFAGSLDSTLGEGASQALGTALPAGVGAVAATLAAGGSGRAAFQNAIKSTVIGQIGGASAAAAKAALASQAAAYVGATGAASPVVGGLAQMAAYVNPVTIGVAAAVAGMQAASANRARTRAKQGAEQRQFTRSLTTIGNMMPALEFGGGVDNAIDRMHKSYTVPPSSHVGLDVSTVERALGLQEAIGTPNTHAGMRRGVEGAKLLKEYPQLLSQNVENMADEALAGAGARAAGRLAVQLAIPGVKPAFDQMMRGQISRAQFQAVSKRSFNEFRNSEAYKKALIPQTLHERRAELAAALAKTSTSARGPADYKKDKVAIKAAYEQTFVKEAEDLAQQYKQGGISHGELLAKLPTNYRLIRTKEYDSDYDGYRQVSKVVHGPTYAKQQEEERRRREE